MIGYKKIYNPLADLGRIKDSLISLFLDTEDLTRLIMPTLDNIKFTQEQNWYGGNYQTTISGKYESTDLIGHCFDVQYVDGCITDTRSCIFVESYISRIPNERIKEVKINVCVVCDKKLKNLSDEDKKYYHKLGIYGNRIDSALQVINSTLMSDSIKNKFGIGDIRLSENSPIGLFLPNNNYYGKSLNYTYQTFYLTDKNS